MAKMTRQEGKEDLLRRIEQAKNSEFDIKKIEFSSSEKEVKGKLKLKFIEIKEW